MKDSPAASLGPKEEIVYNDGFVVAVILGLIALVSPMLWIGWWLVAELGERANGTHGARRYETSGSKLRRAA